MGTLPQKTKAKGEERPLHSVQDLKKINVQKTGKLHIFFD